MANVKELNINSTTYDIIGKGIVDQNNTSTPLKEWSGTKAQYDAIATKDANTIYNITDDTNPTQALLETIYPVGAIYIGTMNICPLSALFGTWQLVAQDRVLQGAGTRGSVGTTINESLPNVKGRAADNISAADASSLNNSVEGAFYYGELKNASNVYYAGKATNENMALCIDASRSSSTYQDNAPVQQDAYLVNIWQRTA